ncbi:hypothetical protein ACWDRR_03950 [Kitasatospora sp. NPDC003701]
MTTEDIGDAGEALTVRLGDPPLPLPAPVADLVRAYLAEQPRLARASSRSTAWLFPGRQPGHPMDPTGLLDQLRAAGVPAQRDRASAIRQLVLQAPAAVVARALGYHDRTTTHLVVEGGGTWSRYTPGDHSQ